ncbi:MAG: 3-deoxy-D-manno-octulosonate 8-phosphate phosphatase [Flavipsychrobacter sp.]|nr:3-deoxy-D-manno-octulosonate 8-phosphate phosphatase [Flavipsychrobacter sp.]
MNLLELFKPINTFVFEIEGVLADNVVSLTEAGGMLHYLHSRDIYALQAALTRGYKLWFITSGKDEWLAEWHDKGVHIINRIYNNPQEILRSIQSGTDYRNILFAGADMPAVSLMKDYWLSVCPADAVAEVKKLAQYISPSAGGNGCVRDVVEKVLKLNGHW